jgi:hypothetical protein
MCALLFSLPSYIPGYDAALTSKCVPTFWRKTLLFFGVEDMETARFL